MRENSSALTLLLLLLTLTQRLSLANPSLTPKAAVELVRGSSRPDDFNATVARLTRLRPEGEIADLLGRAAAAGRCRGNNPPQPSIVHGGLWPDELLHDANLAECRGDNAPPPALVILVFSSATPGGATRRAAVRRTWGSRRGLAVANILGRAATGAEQATVDAEATKHADIVQFRMLDDMAWATRRHLASIEWALDRCAGARHLVHVEDSVFVDTTHLAAYLSASPPPGILCSTRRNISPDRARGSLWFVSALDFPASRYPDHCNAAAYVLSNETALRLLVCATMKPGFWIDDIHVTGVLREAAELELTDFPPGHGFGRILPSDSRAWSSASDYMFLRDDHPEFVGHYWPGLWRSLLLRECSNMIF